MLESSQRVVNGTKLLSICLVSHVGGTATMNGGIFIGEFTTALHKLV